MMKVWRVYCHLFPHLPERSRFNRRWRNLSQVFNLIRQVILRLMEGKWSRIWEGDLEENNNFFGYKLHIILAVIGLILDFELAPAIHTDLSVGQELMEGYADLSNWRQRLYQRLSFRAIRREKHSFDYFVPSKPKRTDVAYRPEAIQWLAPNRWDSERSTSRTVSHREELCSQFSRTVRSVIFKTDRAHSVHLPQSFAWEARVSAN